MGWWGADAAPVDFQREIRPILSNHCYACHGPDAKARQADLRLDVAASAIVELGGKAIRRDAPDESPLLHRIVSADPDEQMPPAVTNKPLSDAQRELLRRWIQEGATWDERHWAYQPPQRPTVPAGSDRGGHPIDAFIRERLEHARIHPSPAADRTTLARRLSLDLHGLPPDVRAVDQFLSDSRPDATARWVDRLLDSPHFGERMAVYWFDLVRFANSMGLHSDNEWEVTPYRNWVIDAFNANMPFDRFTREQLAGDLLPDATLSQRIAAGYNRLNLVTAEGGAQAKEYLVKYTADRVRNAGTVWLASTIGCAECHDHKFDPITTRDFYRFGAFFADIQQRGVYSEPDFGPYVELPTAEQAAARERLQAQIDPAKIDYEKNTPELLAAMLAWDETVGETVRRPLEWSPWHVVGPFPAQNFEEAHRRPFGPEESLSDFTSEADGPADKRAHLLARQYDAGQRKWTERTDWKDNETIPLDGENSATYVTRQVTSPTPRRIVLQIGSDDGLRVWLNGQEVLDRPVIRSVKAGEESITWELPAGTSNVLMKIGNGGGSSGFHFSFSVPGTDLPRKIAEIVRLPRQDRSEAQARDIADHFRSISPLWQGPRDRLQGLQQQLDRVNEGVLRNIATVTVSPQPIRVLPRGNWMDDSGELVLPYWPESMSSRGTGPADEVRRTRRDLAEWIVDRDNPLTARVFVNRLWMLFFGAGICKSVDDFGFQGEMPTHPELLDWLAVEFIESGWDIKHMIRLIVTSDTYAQSSAARPDLNSVDPLNRFVAAQGRFRLDAEFVRDSALHVSGRLNPTVGGRAVSKPYQPAGYYRHMNFPVREYQDDKDDNQYRRGVYVHRQRMFLHPAMLALDAPSREECVAERRRSNTPLAALVLMNDPSFVESARVFATEILRSGNASRAELLRSAFRRALSRPATDAELSILEQLWVDQLAVFASHTEDAKQLIAVGMTPVPTDLDPTALAAWTMVSRALLNTHEMITRY